MDELMNDFFPPDFDEFMNVKTDPLFRRYNQTSSSWRRERKR